ncbi:SLBB domain-containing protein [Thermodesulfobacteriota bacterium]
MNRFRYSFVFIMMILLILFSFAGITIAQMTTVPSEIDEEYLQHAIESGRLTSQQVQKILEAKKQGRLTPELLKLIQQKPATGDITPVEIEAGKKLLEKTREEAKKKEEEGKREVLEKMKAEKEKREILKKKEIIPVRPELQIFGHKLFSQAPSTFAPITDVPVSDNYIIGPGDEIKIFMWGRLDATYDLGVDNEGGIHFPEIGPLTVAGLTFKEVKDLIRQKAEAITGVNVNVSMGRLRTIQVFVLGEVKNPGVFTVSSLASVSNALLYSGGPTDLGSLRKVQLKRQGKVVASIDFYDFLLKGDTSADTRLMPGDVIFVHQTGPMVTVSGDVKRPAVYELKDTKTLRNALKLAGGLKPGAFNQRIQIVRAFENQDRIILDIPFVNLPKKEVISLQDGDLIRVFPILSLTVNAVHLYGNVMRPGEYAYKPGLRILDIIPTIEKLDKNTYFDYALIKRYRMEDTKRELIPFDLGRLLIAKDKTQDVLLAPRDEIYIFNKSMFEDLPSVIVEGQVRKSGPYSLGEKGMRIKDLIFKAGGITKDAYMQLGHIYRTGRHTKEVTMLDFNLEKALADDFQHNLLIQDLDRLIIHNALEYINQFEVQIKGMVHNPGPFPYAANMTVKDLILVAGNLMPAAYMEDAELARYDIIDGMKVEVSILNVNVRSALENHPDHNLKLQPLDVVTIKEIPEWWGKKDTVSIGGEVRFPGTYQIRKGEHLSDLIDRAGGYTEQAYLTGAVFTRGSVKELQQQRLDELVKEIESDVNRISSEEIQAALSKEDLDAQAQFLKSRKALLAKLSQTRASGRVVMKLTPQSVLRESRTDIALEGGDTLLVPKKPDTVSVLGSVYNPSALVFDERRRELKYYLGLTGGPTENAEGKYMYIVRANGTVISKQESSWFGAAWNQEDNRWQMGMEFEETPLHPGDTVLVPEKIVRPAYMRDIKDITTILYQIAVTAGVTITQVF